MGENARAAPLWLRALDINKKAFGEVHPNYAQSLHNLSGFYMAIGDYSRAAPLLRQTLEIRKRVLGEEHPTMP